MAEKRQKRKEKAKNKKQEEMSGRNLLTPTSEEAEKKPAYNYDAVSGTLKYIPNYQFFLWNEDFGENADGTCSSVATQLLLSYHNWASDGRLIPENYELEAPFEFFKGDRQGDVRAVPYDNLMTATTSNDSKTDTITTFYEVIKGYINPYARTPEEVEAEEPEDGRNNGARAWDVYDGIEEYLSDYADSSVEVDMSVGLFDVGDYIVSTIKDEIDAGRPVWTSMYHYSYDKNNNLEEEPHAVVTYGYQTIDFGDEIVDGLIAHFGWKKKSNIEYTNIWFNCDWAYDFLIFEVNHTHNYSTFIMGDGTPKAHINYCSDCGVTQPTGEHTFTGNKTPLGHENHRQYYTHHSISCSCGYKDIDEHTPDGTPQRISLVDMDFYNQYDSTYHLQNCKDCSGEVLVRHDYYFSKYDPRPITSVDEDRQTKHWGKCDCGREEKIPHKFYSYEKEEGNVSYHKSHCECGFWKYEPHYFKLNRPYCHYCGYSIE